MLTQQEAARKWLLYLQVWMNAAPDTRRSRTAQRHMNGLYTRYHLDTMRLRDLPDFPRQQATRLAKLARTARG
jgi:hypothetical protein